MRLLHGFFVVWILFSSNSFSNHQGIPRREFVRACAAFLSVPTVLGQSQRSNDSGTVTWEIIGHNSSEALSRGEALFGLNQTVGEVTRLILDKVGLEYQGNEFGVLSISGSPTGDDALEVLSDTRMKSYGWCYELDGVQPPTMPSEYLIKKAHVHLKWFYGYVEYNRGKWDLTCKPAL